MANIDHDRKRITAVLLFYGPPGAGKTTSLYALARHLPPGTHGKVAPLQAGDDRLLRLDYRPHDHELVYGYQLSFRLVTCPGAIEVDLVRPVLQAADAVMFVADSAPNSLAANTKALELLDKIARSAGRRLDDVPMVFMYNKRDLRDALEIRLLESRLNRTGANYLAASAIRGQGVLEALQRLTASVAVQLRTELQDAPGVKGSTAATVAHGTTFAQARAVHEAPGHDLDDVTAVSGDRGASPPSPWSLDSASDDRTEVNPMGGGWDEDGAPQPAAPTRAPAAPAAPARPAGRAQPSAPAPSKVPPPARGFTPSHGDTGRHVAVPDAADLTDVSAWTDEPPAAAPAPRSARVSGRAVPATPAPPPPPAPVYADGLWRTPDQFADIDSDDHTSPYMDFDEEVGAGPASAPAPAGRGGPVPATASHRFPARAAPPVVAAPPPRPPPTASPSRPPAPAPPAPPPRIEPVRTAAPAESSARARRVEPPPARGAASTSTASMRAAPPPSVGPVRASAPPPVADAGAFTKTMAINALGRDAEAWESGIEQSGHMVRVRAEDLSGYVVSRIGTPSAASRRTVRIPIRATHMDTMVPQDFILDIEFRGGDAATSAARVGASAGQGRMVPLSWLVSSLGVFIVAGVLLWIAFSAGG